MGQTWVDLLFAHWTVPEPELRAAVPSAVPIDTFQGSAWIGVTPFEIVGLHPRGLPPVPRFPELNLRTYTTIGGRPGIWFLSLDAGRALAATAARLTYRLPYRHARMSIARAAGRIHFRSDAEGVRAALRATYEPGGPVSLPEPGTLEHFLTERYRLYTLDGSGRLRHADIHHAPWPLQPARAEFAENTLTTAFGIPLPAGEPMLHYAARLDVLIWPLRRTTLHEAVHFRVRRSSQGRPSHQRRKP
jgi:uncharacterized protein YqjF (DUF2071 family)